MYRKFVAWITGGTCVYLISDRDNIYPTIAYSYGDKRCAAVYFSIFTGSLNNVGHVELNPDGTCSGRSAYIKTWTFTKPTTTSPDICRHGYPEN